MNDAVVVIFQIIGKENRSLITEEMFLYYYEKCKEDKLI